MNLKPRIRSASETNPGVVCCSSNDVKLRCVKCQAFAAAEKRTLRTNSHQEDTVKHDYSPPDSYAPALAKLRAATATPESRFEEQYKADRLRELDAQRANIDAHIAAHPRPRLTAAELAAIPAAPDPYAPGLAAMKANR